jgi:hypothetical protein
VLDEAINVFLATLSHPRLFLGPNAVQKLVQNIASFACTSFINRGRCVLTVVHMFVLSTTPYYLRPLDETYPPYSLKPEDAAHLIVPHTRVNDFIC